MANVRTAPAEPAGPKPATPSPALTLPARRRRRTLAFTARPTTPGYGWAAGARHRYNRAPRRHARNGWQRAGHN